MNAKGGTGPTEPQACCVHFSFHFFHRRSCGLGNASVSSEYWAYKHLLPGTAAQYTLNSKPAAVSNTWICSRMFIKKREKRPWGMTHVEDPS